MLFSYLAGQSSHDWGHLRAAAADMINSEILHAQTHLSKEWFKGTVLFVVNLSASLTPPGTTQLSMHAKTALDGCLASD